LELGKKSGSMLTASRQMCTAADVGFHSGDQQQRFSRAYHIAYLAVFK
jgi:hypothetical protein